MRGGLAALLLIALAPAAARAQEPSLFERLNLDRLHLTALGASIGVVAPSQVVPTRIYAVHADYGEIAPGWRVVFVASYWGSRYTDAVMRAFTDSLRRVIVDPAGDDTLHVGRTTVSDIAVGVDVRWTPGSPSHLIRPYAGAGFGAHVVNAEGPAIAGTFVERALDYIATGVATFAGLDVGITPHISLGAQARFDLLSGVRAGSIRVGGSYRFGLDRPPVVPPAQRPAQDAAAVAGRSISSTLPRASTPAP